MALTKVTVEGMRQALSAMENTVEQSQRRLSVTEDTIAGLSSTWTGAAANGFQHARVAWSGNCHTILQAMRDLITAMESAARDYHATEELSTQDAERLRSEFGSMDLSASV